MFGTLVVVLPSRFEGGELVVQHLDHTASIDLHHASDDTLAWAAFYADCTHEIRPVVSGARATLIYNLVRPGATAAPPDPSAQVPELVEELQRWTEAGDPKKLIWVLDHHYTSAELGWGSIKGTDQSRARALRSAAHLSGHVAHLAMVSIRECWSAEELSYGYGRRHRYLPDPDPDPHEVELFDLIERERTLSDWIDVDGEATGGPPLPFEDHEVFPLGSLKGEEPDAFHYHEATGNEGATVERTYRRAAVVLWPRSHLAQVAAEGGLATIAHALSEIDRGADPDLVDELGMLGVMRVARAPTDALRAYAAGHDCFWAEISPGCTRARPRL